MKKQTNMRFSEEAQYLLQILAQKLGVNQTSVVEIAVRELAEKKGVREEQEKRPSKDLLTVE